MKANELCLISIMAAIETVVFTGFSFVLYLEFITFTVVIFAMIFPRKISVSAACIFGILNMILVQGVTPWSICYLLIYPCYSLIVSFVKQYVSKQFIILCVLCGFFSFLTGQLVQLPFLLFSKYVTAIYLIMGLKTSLIQGIAAGISCAVLYKPVERVLRLICDRFI